MKILKTIFWTTVFWLLVLLVIFGYTKYTKNGEGLANNIAKNLWVVPVMETTTWSMTDWMSDELMKIQEDLAQIKEGVKFLVEEEILGDDDKTKEEVEGTTDASTIMIPVTDEMTITWDVSITTDEVIITTETGPAE